MTKVSNKLAYPDKQIPTLNDYLFGTDDATQKKQNKSFQFSDIQTLIVQGLSPEIGGTLAINGITYTGVLTAPEAVLNALNPNKIVLSYEVLIVSVNNDKYIFKKQDVTVGSTGTYTAVNADFIKISTTGQSITVDQEIIEDSENAVAGGAVFTALAGKATTAQALYEPICVSLTDLVSNIVTGTTKEYLPLTFAGTITSVQADVLVAQATGSVLTFDIKKNGVSIFSTRVTINNTQLSSSTSSIPYVFITGSNDFIAGDRLTFDITVGTSSVAKGAKMTINVQRV